METTAHHQDHRPNLEQTIHRRFYLTRLHHSGNAPVTGHKPNTHWNTTTSTGLLRGVQDSDPEAWNRLVKVYGGLILYWCRKAGLAEADRADVFQDVFRAVHNHLGSFRREAAGDSFRSWLRTVTRNKMIDHIRSQQRHASAAGGSEAAGMLRQLQDPVADPSQSDTSAESSLILHRALETIRPDFAERTWQAFWRSAADGIPTHSLADELDMTPAAIRKAKSRVLQRLRAELEQLEDVDGLFAQTRLESQ